MNRGWQSRLVMVVCGVMANGSIQAAQLNLAMSEDSSAFSPEDNVAVVFSHMFTAVQQPLDVQTALHALQQRMLEEQQAAHIEDLQQEVSILAHTLWQTTQWRVYQHSQYNAQVATDKLKQGAIQQLGLEDLSLSVGYGVEYFFSPLHAIGYEYVSNFPHDRGQSIRVFWVRRF